MQKIPDKLSLLQILCKYCQVVQNIEKVFWSGDGAICLLPCLHNNSVRWAGQGRGRQHPFISCRITIHIGQREEKGRRIGTNRLLWFRKSNKNRKEVRIPHGNYNNGHEVQAIPNMLRQKIWRRASIAGIQLPTLNHLLMAITRYDGTSESLAGPKYGGADGKLDGS